VDRLQPLKRATSPFDAGTPTGRGHHWVEPTLVAEVRFTEWTEEGGIRHPAFFGLRVDKSPRDCRREVGVIAPNANGAEPESSPSTKARVAGASARHGARERTKAPRAEPDEPADRNVVVTNPTKVFWPEEGYTKSDLVGYYESIAPWLLPYLRARPVVLTRYPDGIRGKSFFQKDAPTWVPSWVHTERIRAEGVQRDIDYFIVDDVETLRYVANTGTIPLHLWASRLSALDRPDWLVLDLDPKGAPFTDVVKIALVIRRILEELELPSYPKTSGATGLHILLPLGARYSYEETRTFARLLATLAVRASGHRHHRPDDPHPRRQGLRRLRPERPGPDHRRPFSVRPLPGAPVSGRCAGRR
jgi:bifunctional non-homologous end joining protein LigD